MQMPRFSQKALLQINMVLGGFVVLTNGSALLLTASGGRSHVANQMGEIALWALAGAVLLALSVFGLRHAERAPRVLETQVLVAFGLIGALAIWGLAIATGLHRFEGRFSWSAGFLSVLALYCYVLYVNVTAIRGWAKSYRPMALVFVAACIAIDVAAFMAAMKA